MEREGRIRLGGIIKGEEVTLDKVVPGEEKTQGYLAPATVETPELKLVLAAS